MTEREAFAKTLEIHNTGGLIVPCRSREEAELLASEITNEAKSKGHVLLCRALNGQVPPA